MSDPHRNFLVTCVGAYEDSGLGTGGLVCLHDAGALVVDKIDSTGLCVSGDLVHRFGRGMRTLFTYGPEGARSLLRLPGAIDVHDVLVVGEELIAVSTGTNEVLWFDVQGRVRRRWKAPGERDAWHLNCLWEADGRLFVSAFGRFSEHRGWCGKCVGTGFVMDLESGREVMSGLNGPHNPRLIDGDWVVCDSHVSALIVQAPDGSRRTVSLGGFTRGLAFDAGYFYVGVNSDRKTATTESFANVAVVDRASLEVVRRIEIPFPEIYDIVSIAPEYAGSIARDAAAFRWDTQADRVLALENQVELGLEEIAALNERLAEALASMSLRGAFGKMKRALISPRSNRS